MELFTSFTSEEMHAIKAAIDLALQHKEELSLAVELVETAQRKLDEALMTSAAYIHPVTITF